MHEQNDAPHATPACRVVHAGERYRGKQELDYGAGVSAQSVGALGLCMHLVTIPPGGAARPHLHAGHESALYVLQGRAGMWWGDGLREHLDIAAGDFAYIPANVPHQPYNASDSEPCVAVLARTDPNEQESVTPYPEQAASSQ